MGGSGEHYDRDTRDGYARTAKGTSVVAEKEMSRQGVDRGLLPKNRLLTCEAQSPIVYAFDVTGSMDNLPKIIYDKMPLMAGQIAECGYLRDPQVSLAAVGDIVCDDAPLQIGDFTKMRKLDDWLKRMWLEKGGGGQAVESYEYAAYFYARFCELPKAKTPFFLFTGDEGFRETLYASDLTRHFGGKHKDVETKDIFDELKRKFMDNVILLHRPYRDSDDVDIVRQWSGVLGKDHIVVLKSDQAVADVTLGIFAIVSGARTLEEYLRDLKTTRDVPQTDARIREVRQSLAGLKQMRQQPCLPDDDVEPLPLDK